MPAEILIKGDSSVSASGAWRSRRIVSSGCKLLFTISLHFSVVSLSLHPKPYFR